MRQLEEQQQVQSDAYQAVQQQISHWPLYEEWQQLSSQPAAVAEKDAQEISRFYQTYQHLTEDIHQKKQNLIVWNKGKLQINISLSGQRTFDHSDPSETS